MDGVFDPRIYETFFWNYEGGQIYPLPFEEFFDGEPDYMAFKKFQLWYKLVSGASLHQSEINFRIMRYSYVLLMLAEAENEMGNIAMAVNAVNENGPEPI